MRFASTRGGSPLSFIEAALQGYPEDGGFFLPDGEADLRSAVYAPANGFADAAALAAAEILSEALDPLAALDLAQSVFSCEPGLHFVRDDILVLDLARGPSACAADYAASFTAAIFRRFCRPGQDLLIAAVEGREGSALSSAFGSPGPDLPLILLGSADSQIRLPEAELLRNGGKVILLQVKGGLNAARELEREAARSSSSAKAALGSPFSGRRFIACGAATPVRLLGRCLLLVGLFSLARRGLSGDLIVTAPPGDLLGLVTGLWTWSWGLPVTAFLLPRRAGEPSSGLLLDLLSGYGEGVESAGAEFLERFDAEYPLGSLVLRAETGKDLAPGPLTLPDGLALDEASGLAFASSRMALEAGLTGHARIVVPRFSDPDWKGSPVTVPDALIHSSLDELGSAVERLL